MFGSIDPPHNKPPLIINPPPWGENIFVTINLDGDSISPLIKKNQGLVKPPLILTIGGLIDDRKSID